MMKSALPLVLAVALLAAASSAQAPSALRTLVDSELAFAAFTAAHGIHDGFLASLAEGSIVFSPGPTDARAVYAKVKPSPTLLVWYPAYAWISRSGDLGYTTGPWERFKAKGDKAPAAWGHFVSLWRKQADGTFKVAVDAGVSHAAPAEKAPVFAPADSTAAALPVPANASGRAESELAALEEGVARASAEKGYPAAVGPFLGPDIRVYRAGEFPAVGPQAAFELIRKGGGRWSCKPDRVAASAAGDLGYVYGIMESVPAGGKAAFLRIWRRALDGRWRLALDLIDPFPAA